MDHSPSTQGQSTSLKMTETLLPTTSVTLHWLLNFKHPIHQTTFKDDLELKRIVSLSLGITGLNIFESFIDKNSQLHVILRNPPNELNVLLKNHAHMNYAMQTDNFCLLVKNLTVYGHNTYLYFGWHTRHG